MLRFLDFLSVPVAVYCATTLWGDHVGYHSWYAMGLIVLCNLLGYFRGMQVGASL